MSDSGPDYGLARFLAWVFVLIGFEVVAGGIGAAAGLVAGLLSGGAFLVVWALMSLAAVSFKK